MNNESVKVEMPHKNPIVQYSDGQFQFKVPFIMYADFESMLEPIQSPENDPRISSTRGVNNHVPSGWCVRSEFAYGKVESPLKLYRGKDCVEKFCKHIIGEARSLYCSFSEKPMDPLTKAQLKKYEEARICHICFKPFNVENPKVRDHCHYTGCYRGPAHMKCNLQYKIPSYIPIVFHNLSGYNAHLFIKELASITDGSIGHMGVIAKNTEDYISFSFKVEVNKYMNKKGIERPKEIELRFIDSFKFMSSSLDSLVNNLARGGNEFFGFEEYRLELLLDPDMLLMFERRIRGGITQSVNRWAKANNPYIGPNFAPDKPTKHLQYLDANNSYGWAMSQPLPTGWFKWVSIKPSKISEFAKCKSKGYILEVDVRYPWKLHDCHNDLPFMCKRMKINGVEKLIPNLYDKKRYVIHIRALDQALKHGLV